MRAWTLGSGSRGNALLFECDGTRILVDDGYPPRALAKRLAMTGVTPESIDAVVVTHEHIDHMRGIATAVSRWGWRVYGTAGTLRGITDFDTPQGHAVTPGVSFAAGAFDITLVPVPHDATAPAAVVLTARRSGCRAGVAHDLGAVPTALREAFATLDLLFLEFNHDEEMLRNGPYPRFLQERIAGGSGHLSNRVAGAFARDLMWRGLRALVLLHLSETNNAPGLAVEAATTALGRGRTRIPVTAAAQDTVMGPFGAPAAQLALPF